jgi:hypothetical protein
MASTYGETESGTSIREALRALRNAGVARDAGGLSLVSPDGPALELTPADATPPRLEPAASIEGESLGARPVGEPQAAFAAFLDGIQSSRVILRGRDGAPIVHGTVAAVIRERTDRVLHVWRGAPRISRALYVPAALVDAAALERLRAARMEIIDTLAGDAPAPRHPMELLTLARTAVQRRREGLETELAEAWCASARAPLFIDGGISNAGMASQSALAVGVVKSHRTLYAGEQSLGVITALAVGSRSTAFEIRSPRRTTVASWYLRLRDAEGRDPFFGLVRLEIARDSWSAGRADEVSRWVLAERSPVSLPDKRWSTMAYGIRDCEEYLRALTGA